MEVHQAHRRQLVSTLLEQRRDGREGVLDGLHVGAALGVDHGELGALVGVEEAPAPAGHAARAVIQRAQDALVTFELGVHLALVPDVVAGRDHVHARGEERRRGAGSEAHAAGHVLAVGGHEVHPARLAQLGQHALHGLTPGPPDDVADHEHAHDPRPRTVSQAREPIGRQDLVGGALRAPTPRIVIRHRCRV